MEIEKELVATWGLRIGTQFVPIHLIGELCEQDAFSTEFGDTPVNVPPMMAVALKDAGLVVQRTRGSLYASNGLKEIYNRWEG